MTAACCGSWTSTAFGSCSKPRSRSGHRPRTEPSSSRWWSRSRSILGERRRRRAPSRAPSSSVARRSRGRCRSGVGADEPGRVLLEALQAPRRAEVVRRALVDRPIARRGHVDRHAADGVDLLVAGDLGRRGGLEVAGRPLPNELGEDRDGDLLVRDPAEIEAGGRVDAGEDVVGEPAVAEVAEDGLGPLARGDEPDVPGRGGERALERVLVVVALRGDDDEGAFADVGGLQVERRQHAPGVRVVLGRARPRRRRPSASRARPPSRRASPRRGIGRSRRAAAAAGPVPRRPPSAPSLWHAIGTVTTPSRPRAASSSGGPRNSRRGVPSSSAFRPSRITVGSAHAPPSHPRTRRSGVITAVEPSLPEDGRPAPDHRGEHERLAPRATGPRRARGRRASRVSPPSPPGSPPRPSPLVSGMSMFRTPRCHSASITAFTNAAGEPTVADSPTPLAPIGWCGDGVTVSPSSNLRRLPRGRQQVVDEVGADAVAVLVERDLLHRRDAEPLASGRRGSGPRRSSG